MGRQDYETPLVPVAFAHQQGGNIDLHTSRDMALALQRSQTQAVCFTAKDHGGDASDMSPTLRAGGHSASHANAGVMPAVCFSGQMSEPSWSVEQAETLQAKNPRAIAHASAVRRLTPRECERLQGFPDNYTLIPYRGKPAADGPRYKALGNSMAVPVMAFIGRRIQMVEDMTKEMRDAA
jgi:DNA (cytosine-5)-methyltransferase 1